MPESRALERFRTSNFWDLCAALIISNAAPTVQAASSSPIMAKAVGEKSIDPSYARAAADATDH
jgi:hypothetical protein